MLTAINSNKTFGAKYEFLVPNNTTISKIAEEFGSVCLENGKTFKGIYNGKAIGDLKSNEAIIEKWDKSKAGKILIHVLDGAAEVSQKFKKALIDLGIRLCSM